MGAVDTSVTVFSAFYLTTVALLALVDERRPDVYVSVAALLYFVYISLDEGVRRATKLGPINALIFIAFAVAAAYRIAVTLGWSPW